MLAPHATPQPAAGGKRLGTFAALAVPNYRVYWLGLILYVIGQRTEYVTYAWMIWELKHDPLYLGYFGLAQGVPLVLFQLGAGVLADRTRRVRLLIGTQTLTGLTLTGAFAITVAGLAQVEHLLLLSALSSVFRAFDEPSRLALVPQLVGRERLANAIALGSIPWQSGRILGPSVAGIIIWAFGGAVGFALAALASYGAIALYSRIRHKETPRAGDGRSVFLQWVEGIRFIRHSFLFASLIGLAFINSLFAMSYVALLPIFADRYFGVGSTGYGLMQAAQGIGSVVGTLAIATLAQRLHGRGRVMLAGATSSGLLLMVFSQSPLLELVMIVLAVMGFSNTFYLTLVNTVLQENVPDQLRGRVMSIYSLSWNLVPIGGLLAGALAHVVDARFAVLVGGAVVAANALLVASSRRVRSLA